mgnify:CR=1 FL=1
MRLGEIKQNIDKVLIANKTIQLKSDAVYGGQAYKINNYSDVIIVLEHVASLSWSGVNIDAIDEIITQYPKNNIVELPQSQFNKLTSFINTVNQKIPLYYSILETMVEKQDELTINIKLPEKIKNLNDINIANKRLEDVLKLYNIDGQFEFVGFDKGSEWYVLVAKGVLSYQFIVSCLKIAQEYLKTKAEYFKSEEARISYEASLKEDEKNSDSGFEKYKESWLKLFTEKEIEKVIDKINKKNGHTKEELQVRLVNATTKLVKELGEGTEFHLSLNPPEYVSEQAGQIVIDYKKIEALKPPIDVKQIAG